ncbi:hypothetical protein ISF12_10260 [Pseudomonas aeruginosa]|nr:hypothetical protein [Pseudomonas aeruginosa]
MSELSYAQHKAGDQSDHQLDGDFDFQDIEELSGTRANAFDTGVELSSNELNLDLHEEELEKKPRRPSAPGFNDDEDVVEEKPKKTNTTRWIILISAGVSIPLVCGLLYFGMKVFSPAPSQQVAAIPALSQAAPSVDEVQIDAGAVGFAQPGKVDSVAPEAKLQGQLPGQHADQTLHAGDGVDQAIMGSNMPSGHVPPNDLVVTQGIQQGSQPAPATPGSEPVQGVVTGEEAEYDKALDSLNGVNVPVGAVRIDPTAIQRQLTEQQVGKLESNLQGVQQDLGAMKSLVRDMQNNMASLHQSIEANQGKQAAIEGQLAKLAEAMTTANNQQAAADAQRTKEMESLRAAIAGIEDRAAKAEVAARASTRAEANSRSSVQAAPEKPAPAPAKKPAPQVADVRPQQSAPVPNVASAKPGYTMPVTAPQPSQVAVQSRQPAPETSSVPDQCSGSKAVVSGIWRVKGVNGTSAYIVRSEDNTGLYLRSNTPVPGFGVVVGFDPSSRSVCTTSGLIRR